MFTLPQGGPISSLSLPDIYIHRNDVLIPQIRIDIGGCYFARGDRFDSAGRTADAVSAGKQPILASNTAVVHRFDGPPLERQTIFSKMAAFDILANSHDHRSQAIRTSSA